MQEVEYNDGRRMREFIQPAVGSMKTISEVLADKYRLAMLKADRIKSIKQVRIGRNDMCPCGSGKKFKRCCIGKVNKGPEEVKP